jgi:hypothetical protein
MPEALYLGRKQMTDWPFRPVQDEIFTNNQFSTYIKSLPGFKK